MHAFSRSSLRMFGLLTSIYRTAISFCEAGSRLLEDFAAARPRDNTFLEPKDFSDLRNSAFVGIPEWDAFADHVQACARCGEV
jgi:hypothetical protein